MRNDMEKLYQTSEAAQEYFARHRRSLTRRMVSRREGRLVAELLGDLPLGARLLDVACGTGRISSKLRTKGWSPISLDLSLEMLQKGLAMGTLLRGAVVKASLFRLPFRDQSADGCVCTRFLHHLSRKEERLAALAELRRVVRGPIVVSIWTGFSIQSLRRSLKRLLGRRPSARFRLGMEAFKEELREADLELKRLCFLSRFISETALALIRRPGASAWEEA